LRGKLQPTEGKGAGCLHSLQHAAAQFPSPASPPQCQQRGLLRLRSPQHTAGQSPSPTPTAAYCSAVSFACTPTAVSAAQPPSPALTAACSRAASFTRYCHRRMRGLTKGLRFGRRRAFWRRLAGLAWQASTAECAPRAWSALAWQATGSTWFTRLGCGAKSAFASWNQHRRELVRAWMWSKVGLRVLEPTFFVHGAEGGEARERALGSPTHSLAHRGAWRLASFQGGKEELCTCTALYSKKSGLQLIRRRLAVPTRYPLPQQPERRTLHASLRYYAVGDEVPFGRFVRTLLRQLVHELLKSGPEFPCWYWPKASGFTPPSQLISPRKLCAS
jgi:hypothetical protein